MMATLRSFIALLLVGQCWEARSRRKTGTRFSGSHSKTRNSKGRLAPKKEARPKGPGTPYSLRRNIVRNRPKTMGCLRFGQLILAANRPASAALGLLGGI